MKSPKEAARGVTMRAGMEGLIAAMKGQRRAVTVADPVAGSVTEASEEDDELARVAWRAMNRPLLGSSEGEPVEGGTYLQRGAVVGRYMVLRELGAGGMGVVYAAYDPELDRKVALKLVLPGKGGSDDRTRLLREAQALAKLSHRNVVGIYDVGTMGEQVWLAMELVRGQTLRAWLRTPRAWPDVLRVMRRAGRGLAAAHAAGLLHRDFKPENVMVGKKGGVRVMDFGLARARPSQATLEAGESTRVAMPVVDALAMGVTQAGTLLGTPLYMAPEQLLGRELTPAVDQYALCVTLWEGLYGERPFGGETLETLIDDVRAGRLQEPTQRRAVPGWLRRVCERGLSVAPQQRFSSMQELLATLAKGQTRARMSKGLAVAGVLAGLGMGAEGYRRYDIVQRTEACEASGDEVEVAWSSERRQALHDALVATEVSYAATTADKVMPWIDRQAQAWREARVEACLDTEVRGRWDAQTLDRSLWCLDERRMELQSLVDELTAVDADVLQKAVPVAAGLASVAPCRDESMLEALAPPPHEEREGIAAVRSDVTLAGNLELAGRYGKGLELARSALARAQALRWRPLTAAARLRLGALLQRTGAYAEAEQVLEDAFFEVADGVAPEVAFDAARALVLVVGVRLARHAEGRRWGRHAEAALVGVRDGERLRRADLLGGLANVHVAIGGYEEAKVLHERALAIREEALGPAHPAVADSLNNLANVHETTGDYEEATALHERALAIREEALGPAHPAVADSLNNLAIVHESTGAYAEAQVLYERALAISEAALGPEHLNVASSLDNLALLHQTTGEYDEARALQERALAIVEKVLGPEHPVVATNLGNLAIIHHNAGAYAEAKLLHERALAILEKALGPAHRDVAVSLINLAAVHQATGAYAEAKLLHGRALAILEKALGPEHPDVAKTLNNLALVHSATGEYDEARALHERSLAIREKVLGPDHLNVANTLNNLANVRADTGAFEEAQALHERALAIREKVLGPEHLDVAVSLNNLAAVHQATGEYAEANVLLERALAIREHVLGPEHADVAMSLGNLANVHADAGAHEEARALHERSLAIWEKALGSEHPDLGHPLVGLAEVALAQRRPTHAVALAQRAVTLREKSRVAAHELARARFVLARALWGAPIHGGRDRAWALLLAEQARGAFRAAGQREAKALAEVEQWLGDHGAGP